jgi:hypothetical protein
MFFIDKISNWGKKAATTYATSYRLSILFNYFNTISAIELNNFSDKFKKSL